MSKISFKGILFIGDVHAASHRPGRRIDDYASAVLAKLEQCVAIAAERNLYPVCLGDLFHRARENDLELITRMGRVLRKFPVPMEVLAGSHDRSESWLTDKDAAQLLADMGVIRVWDQPGKITTLKIKDQLVNLWATPAGAPVPHEIPKDDSSTNIMITHHDFDFQGKYPGAHELHEIENCDMLVNGHMHHPCPTVFAGHMACHNPGSITRVSVDLKKAKPVVSVWTPGHGISLEKVELTVAANVFDMTGKEVYAADARTLKEALPKGQRLSSFAAKLRATETLEAQRTDDGSVLLEELQHYFSLFEVSDNLKRYLTGMVGELVAEQMPERTASLALRVG